MRGSLRPQTADLLRALLVERGREPRSDEPVFRNHRGTRLTRFGVRYLLQKYCTRAQASVPALRAKRLHPHSMRHSTAVHLLRAGVDIVTISQWLGHASVTTTHRYATVDLDMKREALAKARPTALDTAVPALWRTDASVLESFTVGERITPFLLPEATGGNGAITYTLIDIATNAMVPGLEFTAGSQLVSGTPTAVGESVMRYSAQDVNGTGTQQTVTQSFKIDDDETQRYVLTLDTEEPTEGGRSKRPSRPTPRTRTACRERP